MDGSLRESVSRADVNILGHTVPRHTEARGFSTEGDGNVVGVPNANDGVVLEGSGMTVEELVLSASVCGWL